MKKQLIILGSAVALACITLSVQAWGDNIKVGVVDMPQFLQNYTAFQKANDKFKEAVADKKKALDAQRVALQDEAKSLSAKAKTMKKKEQEAALKKLENDRLALLKSAEEYQNFVAKQQQDTFAPFSAKIKDAVAAVAKKDNLDLVLSSQAVLYYNNDLDVTKSVSQEIK